MFCQEIKSGSSHMIACIVEDKDDKTLTFCLQKLTQKFVELRRILLGVNQIMHLLGPVIQRPIDAVLLVRSRSRDLDSLALEAPNLGQGRVEVNFTLVKEEEVKVGFLLKRAFFKKARTSFFSLYSFGSRKWPIMCRGRRYTMPCFAISRAR